MMRSNKDVLDYYHYTPVYYKSAIDLENVLSIDYSCGRLGINVHYALEDALSYDIRVYKQEKAFFLEQQYQAINEDRVDVITVDKMDYYFCKPFVIPEEDDGDIPGLKAIQIQIYWYDDQLDCAFYVQTPVRLKEVTEETIRTYCHLQAVHVE